MDTKEKEKIKQQRSEYYNRNREKVKQKAKEYYEQHKQKVLERTRAYQKTESAKQVRKKHRLKHKEQELERARLYRQTNPEKYREYQKQVYYKNLQRTLYNTAKLRAKRSGKEFLIDKEDIIIPDKCPVFGVYFVWGEGLCDFSPSLDRIDSSKGYIKGNVAVISSLANRLKSTATIEQLQLIIDYIKRTMP